MRRDGGVAFFQGLNHAVERARQLSDFIFAGVFHGGREIALRDSSGNQSQPPERRDHLPRQHHRGGNPGKNDQGRDDDDIPDKLGQDLLHPRRGDSDLDHAIDSGGGNIGLHLLLRHFKGEGLNKRLPRSSHDRHRKVVNHLSSGGPNRNDDGATFAAMDADLLYLVGDHHKSRDDRLIVDRP